MEIRIILMFMFIHFVYGISKVLEKLVNVYKNK